MSQSLTSNHAKSGTQLAAMFCFEKSILKQLKVIAHKVQVIIEAMDAQTSVALPQVDPLRLQHVGSHKRRTHKPEGLQIDVGT
jgi:hypothetical protein